MPALKLEVVSWPVLAAIALASAPVAASEPAIKVTLLGTGCPPAVMNRSGPATLVEAGGQSFVVDAGRGALQRLNQVGVNWREVKGVLFTHLHSDHVVGFPDLWLTGWLTRRREMPLLVWGPEGTRRMLGHLEQAYEYDIRIRQSDDMAAADGVTLRVEDIGAGVVYEAGGVKITAFEVDHAPVEPALGYRIDHAGHSVVLSGDTRYSSNLIRHAQGVDLLVHEVAVTESFLRAGHPAARAARIVAHHTTPEQAGLVFARTKPRLAVYSHVCLPDATEQDLVPPTRRHYAGPLEIGEDLMVVEVGEEISVRRPPIDCAAVSGQSRAF